VEKISSNFKSLIQIFWHNSCVSNLKVRKMMKERREYLRIEDSGPVSYYKILPPPQTPSRSGMRENISGGGIKLVIEEGF
jgi:c-di-GMP-binding flagellar brake protein YcgR